MENASKALLIAGAILIAILLIAIGMMVFNSASGVIDTASSGMTDHEKTMHNKKFNVYEGTQRGSMVKEIINIVRTNNSNSENQKVEVQYIKSNGDSFGTSDVKASDSGESVLKLIETQIKTANSYTVTCQDKSQKYNSSDKDDGVISTIKITAK